VIILKIPSKIICLTLLFSLSFILTISSPGFDQPIIEPKVMDFEPYKFIAYGDTRNTPEGDNSGMETTAALIKSVMEQQEISFILHVGDMVDSGGSPDEYEDYWWPNMEDILETVPMYVAPGNHEYSALSGGNDIELVHFRDNVNNPNNSDYDEIYFSFDSPQGDTHFVVLNTEYYFGLPVVNPYNTTRQDQQKAWLAADMAANNASRIVVMLHRPLWGVNEARVTTEYRPLRAELHELLSINYSVDLVIQGHDHHMYHTVRNDTDYMIMGAGTPRLTLPNLNGYYVMEEWLEGDFAFGGDFGISIVTATATGFEVDFVVENGTTIHEFTIDAPAADIYPPVIEYLSDLTFEEGSLGQTLVWTVSDAYPGTYTIFVNDQEEQTGSWIDGGTISFDVSSFTKGTYEVKLELADENGNEALDTVSVTVTPTSTTTGGSTPGLELWVGFLVLLSMGYYLSRKRR